MTSHASSLSKKKKKKIKKRNIKSRKINKKKRKMFKSKYTIILQFCLLLTYGKLLKTFLVPWNLRTISIIIFGLIILLSQTSFSLYLYNQWTDFHKLSCAGKPQMRAIRTYVGCTKVTTNDWDIRPSVAVQASSANISWTAERIRMIELVLESAHQSVSNDIWCISKW